MAWGIGTYKCSYAQKVLEDRRYTTFIAGASKLCSRVGKLPGKRIRAADLYYTSFTDLLHPS